MPLILLDLYQIEFSKPKNNKYVYKISKFYHQQQIYKL